MMNDMQASEGIVAPATNSPPPPPGDNVVSLPVPLNLFFDYFEKHGLALFPIPFGHKEDKGWKRENREADPNLRPIVWSWSRDWSKDHAQWLGWYMQEGRCNFGVYAAASRCIALDLDVAKDRKIWEKYCAFWTARGLTPPAPQFRSARKGWHVLVKVPDGFDLSSLQQSKLMPNVDTRIEGYIVGAGSYYDGAPNGEESGWYEIVADAPPPHDDPAIFQVLVEVLSKKAKYKSGVDKTKARSGGGVDLSLLPPIDEVVARIQHAYDVGPVREEGYRWIKDPAAHADNPNPDDRARREANGYFANYTEWMPVVGAVHALYGESAKDKVAPIMSRGRDHAGDMFGNTWDGKPPAPDVAHAALLRFIKASNHFGFHDGGRYVKAKGERVLEKFKGIAAGMPIVNAESAPLVPGSYPVPRAVQPVPMLGRGAMQAELWGPILATVPHVERTADHPEMPDTGHPLRDAINASIPGIMASGNKDALAVIHATHPQTAAMVGTITTDIEACAAALEQQAENRSLTMSDYRRNFKTGEAERDNIDNMKFFLRSLNIEIRFNEWIEREEIRGWIWGDWQPLDDAAVAQLRMRGSDSTTRFLPGKDFTWDALISLARSNPVDPARDLLDYLESNWDGVPRLATWLPKTCGVPDDSYHRAVGESMLLGLCARIRQPGCKYDLMTVFISERQGTSKSTLARVLALDSDWFAEDVSLGEASKELILLLAGKTVVEISEMRTRGEANNVKAMVSRTHDEARTAYSRKTVKRPRRNIFVGSTNEPEFLEDVTGGRRFLPITVRGEIDLEFVRQNLAQLVGEAATQHSQGCDINLPREIWEIAGEHQEAARITSGVEELLRDWYATPETDVFVPSAEIVRRLADERQSTSLKAVSPIMRSMGYKNHRTAEQRMWVKSATGKYHAECKHVGKAQLLIAPPPPAPGQPSLPFAQAPVAVPMPPY